MGSNAMPLMSKLALGRVQMIRDMMKDSFLG
jgi:hypothetical protein